MTVSPVSVSALSSVCTCVHMCEPMYGEARDQHSSIVLLLIFWDEVSHWTRSSLIWVDCLGSRLQGSSCLCLSSMLGLHTYCHVQLSHGCWTLYSVIMLARASILPVLAISTDPWDVHLLVLCYRSSLLRPHTILRNSTFKDFLCWVR